MESLKSFFEKKKNTVAVIAGVGAVAISSLIIYKYYWAPKIQEKIQEKRRLTFPMKIRESDPQNEQIVIADPEALFAKLKKLKNDGLNQISVISDYDQTISPAEFEGKPCPATFGIIRSSSVIPPQVEQGMRELFQKYHPIESNPNLTVEEKMQPLADWIEGVAHVLKEGGVSGVTLEKAFAESNTAVRKGYTKLFHFLIDNQIPYYIVSGGIADFIELIFDNIDKKWAPSGVVRVHANKFLLDENFNLQGLSHPHIHTLAKAGFLDCKKEKFRKNVILFGDIITDTLMASKVGAETILNIGFLNKNVSEYIGAYEEQYDIVICNDGSYDIPNEIFAYLEGKLDEEEFFKKLQSIRQVHLHD